VRVAVARLFLRRDQLRRHGRLRHGPRHRRAVRRHRARHLWARRPAPACPCRCSRHAPGVRRPSAW